MAVVLIVGCGLGWVIHRARIPCKAVAAIEWAGGRLGSFGLGLHQSSPYGPVTTQAYANTSVGATSRPDVHPARWRRSRATVTAAGLVGKRFTGDAPARVRSACQGTRNLPHQGVWSTNRLASGPTTIQIKPRTRPQRSTQLGSERQRPVKASVSQATTTAQPA